jgi:hypothetical protein
MSPARRLFVAACLLATTATAPAQPPAPNAKAKPPEAKANSPELDRDLFVIYAIEQFYRDTKLDGPFFPPVGSPSFNIFVQSRQRLVDALIQHLRLAPDRAPLVGQMATYRGVLGKLRELNDKATEVQAKYREPVEKFYLDVDRHLKMKRNEDLVFETLPSMIRAYENVRWGWGWGWGGWYGEWGYARRVEAFNHMMNVGYVKTLQSDAKQERMAINRFSRCRQKELDYWAENRPKLESELREVQRASADAIAEARAAGADKLKAVAKALAEKKGWKAAEVAIDPDRDASTISPAERPRDPFPVIWRARVVKSPSLDEPDGLDKAHEAAKLSKSACWCRSTKRMTRSGRKPARWPPRWPSRW